MQRKFVVLAIYLACIIILLIKHFVFVNFSIDDAIESSFRDTFLTLIFGTILAFGYWRASEKQDSTKRLEKRQKQTLSEFYTVPIAMSVFALYLMLFVMRLIIFIDMYVEKPFLLMLEFPIIAIVAIFLFIPFIIKRIHLDDEGDDAEEVPAT